MANNFCCQDGVQISVKVLNVHKYIDVSNIMYIMCDADISKIYLSDSNKPVVVFKLLKLFEKELACYGFFRVNKNTVVNFRYVKNINNSKTRAVKLINGDKIYASVRKYKLLKKTI